MAKIITTKHELPGYSLEVEFDFSLEEFTLTEGKTGKVLLIASFDFIPKLNSLLETSLDIKNMVSEASNKEEENG